jgi:hypothetical protein
VKLSNVDRAIVDPRKLTDYLLSATHPFGRSKAEFFARFGYSGDNWPAFAGALLRHAAEHDVIEWEEVAFGAVYAVEGAGEIAMQEHEVVALDVDQPEYDLARGDLGTIVHVPPGGEGFLVEFITLDGETVAVLALRPDQVRPIGRREIAHVRSVGSKT